MKKPSAANSASTPPKQPVFFLDRSLGRKIVAGVLRDAGFQVEIHDDHFPPDTRDAVWLSEVGKRGWVVLTQDRRIRYRELELRALIRGGVRAFVLTTGQQRGEETGAVLLQAMPRINDALLEFGTTFVATVSRGGLVRKVR